MSAVTSFGRILLPKGGRATIDIAAGLPALRRGWQLGGVTHDEELSDTVWTITKSRFYNKINTQKLAAMGMSCGGNLALEAARDPRVDALGMWNSGVWNSGEMRTGDGTLVAYVNSISSNSDPANAPTLGSLVTGVVVNVKPAVSRKVRRQMRAILHNAGKTGVAGLDGRHTNL